MQGIPLNKNALFSILGTNLGGKLLNLLGACCGSQPAIQIALNATCGAIDPKTGNQSYNVTATASYNISIPGYTTLIGYLSNEPLPNWTAVTNATLDNLNLNTGTIIVNNIVAGAPVVSANLTANKGLTAGTYWALLTDNHGNFSNMLTVIIPNCGASSPTAPASTPASQKTATTG